jgi:PAS domain S-box-containing protein
MPEAHSRLKWLSKNLIEILPGAIYVCDMDAVVIAFNERAAELWGRAPKAGEKDEKYCSSHKLFLPDGTYVPHDECPMEWVLRTGEPARDKEVVIERLDGSRVTVLVNIKPLFDEGGTQTGAVNCFQDLTVQKEAEQERATLREELRQGQKLKAMGQIVGGVAHDFNNLLTPILGNLDMLRRREPRDAREARQLEGAAQAAERAKTLVQRLLAFARRQPLKSAPVDIATLVEGMSGLIGGVAGPQISVILDVSPNLPPAMIDYGQVEMAILNLAVNARDAMPQGGNLRISANSEIIPAGHPSKVAAGRYIRLSVTDTGIGMDEATMDRAIEPFFSTKGIGQGTGLGLSMVDGLANQLGGALLLSSKIGEGTRIDLLLPMSDKAVDDRAGTRMARPNMKVIGRVLLVDDEPLVRASIADMLTDLGYEVVEVGSASEALAYLDHDPQVSGIITDHRMPGMTGVELSRLVAEKAMGTPVLLISGYGDVGEIASDQALLAKPFLQSDLAASLVDLFHLHGKTRSEQSTI